MNILHSLSVAALGALSLSHAAHFDRGPTLLRSPGLPEGSGGKHRYRRLIGEHGCWRPGSEHLPTGGPSRQVSRREARLDWKRGGRPTFAAMGIEPRTPTKVWDDAADASPVQDLRAAWQQSREEASRESGMCIPAGSVIVAPPDAEIEYVAPGRA